MSDETEVIREIIQRLSEQLAQLAMQAATKEDIRDLRQIMDNYALKAVQDTSNAARDKRIDDLEAWRSGIWSKPLANIAASAAIAGVLLEIAHSMHLIP